MPTYSYYPGCSLHGMAKDYDRSVRLIAPKLDVALREIPDWSCCGSTAAHSTDARLALALAARNLELAAPAQLPVLAPCAMCYNRMKVTQHELEDAGRRAAVAEILGQPVHAPADQPEVVSVLEAFAGDEMAPAIEAALVRPLKGLKVVAYYGCLLVRPAAILQPDSVENPQAMDRLLRRLGAEVLDWPFKTECCGGSLALARLDIVLALGRKLLAMAKAVGADCVVTACPMCQSNLDARQGQIKERYGDDFNLPVVYVTELMGMAFGLS
ncbi:MAG TPA: CoB--CoM heterodisulfide reductase iron-sulfur subunit B family protein, partial [Anaerolineae bacterium]